MAGGRRNAVTPEDFLPARRAILLGASNLVLGLPTVVEVIRDTWGAPIDVFAAIGFGRSYGRDSHVLGRRLPGIVSCGLWSDVAQRPPAPTGVLITDIGNDILYGATPVEIAGWVEECLKRLCRVSSHVSLTELPLHSLAKVGRRRFLLMRTILFPKSRITLSQAMEYAQELNQRVQELAGRYGTKLLKPRAEWYGFDPIHVKRRWKREAWRDLLSGWQLDQQPVSPLTLQERWLLRRLRPLQRSLFGIEQRQAQPAGAFDDGTLVSLY